MRVAIIGAGPAGLVSAKHVTAEGMECEVFEMKPELGGTWIYTDDVDKDQYGFPVYSAMYKNLVINLPKEVMGFPDFPLPEQENSYLSQAEILEFLNHYVDHFSLRRLIR
ncbi:FMO-like and/or NAD binding 8 domain containing protein, partial [Asbolus verrucosus]